MNWDTLLADALKAIAVVAAVPLFTLLYQQVARIKDIRLRAMAEWAVAQAEAWAKKQTAAGTKPSGVAKLGKAMEVLTTVGPGATDVARTAAIEAAVIALKK